MQIDLSDKLAIVSGSTAGIGFAIASGLAAAGAVVVNGRSQAAVDRAIAAIRNGQPDARVRAASPATWARRKAARLSLRPSRRRTSWSTTWASSS